MARAAGRDEGTGRRLPRAWPAMPAILCLGACASLTPYRAPTRTELDRVKRVEVASIVGNLTVDFERSPAEGAPAPYPGSSRLRLGPETGRAIASSILERGACETALPFQPVGGRLDKASSARLEVKLVSATLAAGPGPDPLTALWVRYRVRVAVPQPIVEDGALGPVWLGPTYPTAVHPRPRPLSEWVADDGATLRAAVAEISAREVPRFVADLRGGGSPGSCDPGGASSAGTAATSGAPLAEADGDGAATGPPEAATGADLGVEYVSTDSPGGATLKALGFFGGMTVGGVVGAGYGLAFCGKGISGGDKLGALLFMACAVVAAPVGALIGVPMGAVKGFELAEEHVAKDAATRREEIARRRGALAGAVRAADLPRAVAGVNEALVEGGEERPTVGVVRVLIVRHPSHEELADLEVELTLRSGEAANARARQVCLRGPGPLPTELWLRPGGELIRAAVEAHLARAVRLGVWGLEPRSGDGPCR